MRYLLCLLFIGVLLQCTNSETEKVIYEVDIDDIQNDLLKVTIYPPCFDSDTAYFHFAKMDPGHSKAYTNFGLYVEIFQPIGEDGHLLSFKKINENDYMITGAENLSHVIYYMHDTWDDTLHKENKFATCVGTSFQKGVNILNGGVYGFFDEFFNYPVEVRLLNHSNQAVATQLSVIEPGCLYGASGFRELYDNPILSGELDTLSFHLHKTIFNIAIYNEQGISLSQSFKEILIPKLEAVYQFGNNNFPVEEYTFMFYIKDFTRLDEFLIACDDFSNGNTKIALAIDESYNGFEASALEHENAFFFTMTASKPNQKEFEMLDFVIHEFMHIYTPKRLNTNLISDFNFTNPKLSSQRWLYEGVTEYFNGLIKVQSGLLTKQEFLYDYLRPKLTLSNYFPKDFSFYDLSAKANIAPYKYHYFQSYMRGPVLAMLLDIEIIRLTNAEKNLKDVFFSLYNQHKSFTEDQLIDAFVDEVHPDLALFFEKYVKGTDDLPIEEYFSQIGIKYTKEIEMLRPQIEFNAVPLFNYYQVSSSNLDGFSPCDKIDVRDFGRDGLNLFRTDSTFVGTANQNYYTKVYRNGKETSVKVRAPFNKGVVKNYLEFSGQVQPEQKRNYEKWVRI